MTNNNTKTELNELQKALKEGADIQTLRAKIEGDIRSAHGEFVAKLSDQELEQIIANATEFINLAPLAELTAQRVADKVLFNATDSRWYADKAVNIFTTALGVGVAVWAGRKLGVVQTSDSAGSDNSLFGGSTDKTQDNPFADTTPVPVSPRVGKSRPGSLSFDHQAS